MTDGLEIALSLIKEESEKKTGSLDLGNLSLTDLPLELFVLTHLHSLNLGGWYVDEHGRYQKSAHGDKDSANSLHALSHNFSVFGNLVSLSLAGNPVSDLGPLQGLSALQSLDCSRTKVSDLGPLQDLSALQSLHCSDTKVSDLGPLQGLSALQSLTCSRTKVSDLGPLVGLENLNRLKVSHCQLEDFPRQVLFQENLSELLLNETTIPGFPAEILSPDSYSSCLEGLQNHIIDQDSGVEQVLETKLVVLGNGRVGKTQICRRLRNLPYDEKVLSTHGITVTAMKWAGLADGEVLNVWDFGGQDIYHGAHTLFMKTSAVFLIVWHPDFETAGEQSSDGMLFRNYPLSYWLEYVRTLGRKNCPVVVVQTRCDRPEQEARRLPVDDAFLKFPSLKQCWYSAKTNRGHAALEEALRDATGYLRDRDGIITIGTGRASVVRQLKAWRHEDQKLPAEERQHRTLSKTEFCRLCEQIGGVRSPESLLAYLHNLGVVFYQPHLFNAQIILDQSWALEAVYSVFDRQKAYPLLLSLRGRFTQSLLAMTDWREFSHPEQRLFLSLMESCGIAFVYREAEPRLELEAEYLAPDLLPGIGLIADQLEGRWNEHEESWRLEYEYPFLHPGLMRALLCDVGSRSKETGVYWKYGVWVYEKSTGCRALLQQQMIDERRGRIALKVQGRRHEDLVLWLRDRINDRNRLFGYPGLQPSIDNFGPRLWSQEGDGPAQASFGRGKTTGILKRSGEDSTVEASTARAVTEPAFDKPPSTFFPSREPQVFVSYAWGDETAVGKERAKIVDNLCAALAQQGVKVRRDHDEIRPGDLISEFMDRLVEGDFILAVISDKYLRSEYCMYELFRIYRNCADKPERFLGKVIPLILPDANLDRLANRLQRAIYWTKQEDELKPLVTRNVESVGTEFFRKFKLIGEFARNSSNILEYLMDKLQPRDFERQAKEGFEEVFSQIRGYIGK